MRIFYSRSFQKDFQKLRQEVRAQAEKQLALFAENPRRPSLRIKKIPGSGESRREGRVSHRCRFTFDWEGDTIILRVK